MTAPLVLSVLTLNTWKGSGCYADRLRLMTAGFAADAPDIAFLQEAFQAPDLGIDTAAALAAAGGHALAVRPARIKVRRSGGRMAESASAMAVLARGAVLAERNVLLPTDPADGERLAQIVTLAIRGRRVLAVNVHLTYLEGRDDLRLEEIKALVRALPPPDEFHLALLAGDFNCTPESPPLRWLVDESGLAPLDACTAAGSVFPTHGETADGHPPTRRIDYVFLLGGIGRPRVTAAKPAFEHADAAGSYASDHVGVRVEIGLS